MAQEHSKECVKAQKKLKTLKKINKKAKKTYKEEKKKLLKSILFLKEDWKRAKAKKNKAKVSLDKLCSSCNQTEEKPAKKEKKKKKDKRNHSENTSDNNTTPKKITGAESKIKKKDNLCKIYGVGPKIESILNANNIFTFKDISTKDSLQLKEILLSEGNRYQMHDTSSWPSQAQLAKNNDWEGLNQFINQLRNS